MMQPAQSQATLDEVIESHYLETVDGLFFAVKGYVHPPDRYVAYLRYAPDAVGGSRWKGGTRYRRLYHFAEQVDLLRKDYPNYLAFDPVHQLELQGVPRSRVSRVYDPRERLSELRRAAILDAAERDTCAFASLLQQEGGVPWEALGVSGSLLIGLHTEASDLDISAYGEASCRAVNAALRRLLDATDGGPVARLDEEGVRQLYAERVADTHLSYADFVRSERGKVIQGRFRDRPYFIRFLRSPSEMGERYGDFTYSPAGRARITARVLSADASIFTPCRYPIVGVRAEAGDAPPDLAEIVSYRGRFCEQAQAGDTVLAVGQVEKVVARNGRSWHRLLLGNCADDIMLTQD